jgi:hypothetical protein
MLIIFNLIHYFIQYSIWINEIKSILDKLIKVTGLLEWLKGILERLIL